ncbi:ABC-type phosphate transport system, periplasmic component [Lachnospiraceae bacterium JC7]|nr:ABC-type phosphate transport system, periplasmic component [Lachnospiraceae bacterium JC7]
MRKRISAAMIAMAALAVSGCSSSKPAPTQETTTVSPETTAQETKSAAKETEAPETKAEETKSSVAPIKLPDYHYTRENFPRMDGSTATVPLGKAIASAFLDSSEAEVDDLCRFNRTTQSFRNLLAGDADILIVGEPNAKVFKEMEEAGFKYRIENFATDALIFVVNEDNPVDSLTTDQIRDIYSGKITNWKEVGGNDAEIVPFQRNEGAGSQALILKHIMKDTPMMDAPKGLVATEMGELMTAVKSYDNSANAIGYSVYYYANDMKMAKGLKIIAVDGVSPNPETIRSEEYPHRNAYYSVIPEDADPTDEHVKGARVLYDWLVSTDGQRLISKMGYVSVMDVSSYGDSVSDTGHNHQDNFTRLNDAPAGTLTDVTPGGDYGMLIPYDGTSLYVSYGYGADGEDADGYSYLAGYMSGFFDTKGRLITDPVYNSIRVIDYYDYVEKNEISLPYYRAVKYDLPYDSVAFNSEEVTLPSESIHQKLISKDGSFVSPEYGYISGMRDHVLCKSTDETNDFVIYDLNADVVMTYDELNKANDGMIAKKLNQGEYLCEVSYSDGYYVFYLNDGYYYVDADTKKIVLGPYNYAEPFKDGRAFVRVGNFASVIDKTGKEYIGSGYDMADVLRNGYSVGKNDAGTDLYGKDGKLLKKLPVCNSIGVYDWGFYQTFPSDSGWYSVYYDNDGNELLNDEENIWNCGEKSPVAYAYGTKNGPENVNFENSEGIWLKNLLTGKSKFIEGASYAYPFYTIEGTADVPYIKVTTYANEDLDASECVYDEGFNEVFHIDNGYVNITSDVLTNEWLFVCDDSHGNHYSLYDRSFKPLAETESYPEVYENYIVSTCDNASIGLDPKGKEIFCYEMKGAYGNE